MAASFACPSRAHSVAARVPSLGGPVGSPGHPRHLRPLARPPARRSSRPAVHSSAAARRPGRCAELALRPGCHPAAPVSAATPSGRPPDPFWSAVPRGRGGRRRRRRRRDRGAGWSGHLAPRPAPARTPSRASYFRTRKVRAAPGDSAAAPVPGSRVCSRVVRRARSQRRTVQTRPWLRPPPAPASPTSISSSRSSESKRPCLASPPATPSPPPVFLVGSGERDPAGRDGVTDPWLDAGGAERGGNLCPAVAGAPIPQPTLLGSSTSPRET